MDAQSELFPQEKIAHPPATPPSLLIRVSNQPEVRLSKAQKAFNRLVRQIEALRRDIDTATELWNQALASYARELRPVEVEVAQTRKRLIRLLLPFLQKGKKFKPRQRARLKAVVLEQFQGILDVDPTLLDPDLRTAHEALLQEPPSAGEEAAFNAMRDEMEDFCRNLGVDVDLSEIQPGMTSAEVDAKLEEIEKRLQDADPASGGPGAGFQPRKSKREQAREEREREAEELRSRNLTTLYRQLAKLLHPDLEQDPARRLEKEQAMKALTVAYKANDLHALLRMEIQFILREEADAARLTEEKLKVYNEVLRDQVSGLRETLLSVGAHPRFAPLRPYLPPFLTKPNFQTSVYAADLRALIQSMESSVTQMEGPQALEEVRQILRDFGSGPPPGFPPLSGSPV